MSKHLNRQKNPASTTKEELGGPNEHRLKSMADFNHAKEGLSPRITNDKRRRDGTFAGGLAQNSHNGAFIGMTGTFSNTEIENNKRVSSRSPNKQKDLKK